MTAPLGKCDTCGNRYLTAQVIEIDDMDNVVQIEMEWE